MQSTPTDAEFCATRLPLPAGTPETVLVIVFEEASGSDPLMEMLIQSRFPRQQ